MKIVNKKNTYLLLVFVIGLLFIAVNKTYAKFPSSYTTADNIVGLTLDFNIGISNIEEYQRLKLEAGEFKRFNVEISNNMSNNMAYGVWYRVVDGANEDNVEVGKVKGSSTSTSGTISNGSKVTVEVIIINNSNDAISVDIGVGSSSKTVNDIEYLNGKKLIIKEIEKTVKLLSGVKSGSYVKYVGNNGCSGKACEGQNANYVSDTDMGYCASSTYKFTMNGWRVVYIANNTAYLVSAGSPECLCTNSDGKLSNTGCGNYYETTSGVPKHLTNISNTALKYCNSAYAYGGVCNNESAWNMNDNDFNNIINNTLGACYENSNTSCGYGNDLIDNGGLYWFATLYTGSTYNTFSWDPNLHYVSSRVSNFIRGIRPVLRLKSSIFVTGGDGTYKDPYVISS